MEINQETLDKLQAITRGSIKAFNVICENLVQFGRWLKDNWKWIKEKVIEFYQLKEKKPQHKRRLEFTRSKLTHQALDRRPKQITRKTIH